MLAGTVPDGFVTTGNLNILDLSHNSLGPYGVVWTGRVSSQAAASSLQYVDLSFNTLQVCSFACMQLLLLCLSSLGTCLRARCMLVSCKTSAVQPHAGSSLSAAPADSLLNFCHAAKPCRTPTDAGQESLSFSCLWPWS